MRLVVTIPAHQSGVNHVFKKKFQSRGFNMTIAKYHIGFAPMTGICSGGIGPATGISIVIMTPKESISTNYLSTVPMKPIADGHHFTWVDNGGLLHDRLDNICHSGRCMGKSV